MAAPETLVKNLRDGVMTIYDLDEAHSVEVFLDQGDLNIVTSKPVLTILDRGSLSSGHMRYGDDVPMRVSFTELFKAFLSKGAWDYMPWEALTGTGACSGVWDSTAPDNSDVYTVTIWFEVQAIATGNSDERIVLPHFHYNTINFQEGDPNTLAAEGECFATIPIISEATIC